MKIKTIFFFLLGLLTMNCGCHSHDDDSVYQVMVSIVQPTDGKAVAKGVFTPVEVTFSRPNLLIHNILIQVLDANNNVVETLLEKHAHVTGVFSFNEINGFKPANTGTYKLKAQTTDDKGAQPNVKEVTFTVN